MISAMIVARGNVSHSCNQVGISRQTHYNWLETDSEYKQEIENAKESAIDFVEGKLFEKINGVSIQTGFDKEGNPIVYDVPPSDTAIIFYLKTIGKRRGYIERTEHDHTLNTPPIIKLTLPDEYMESFPRPEADISGV